MTNKHGMMPEKFVSTINSFSPFFCQNKTMSPLLSLHSLQELRLSRQLQTLLLVLRLLLAGFIGWQLYNNPVFSTIYINSTSYIALGIYTVLAFIAYILVLFRPTHQSIIQLGTVLDTGLSIALLFLLPDQAQISIVIAISFILAVLNDVRLSGLVALNIVYLIAALAAGWFYDTLIQADLYGSHIISLIIMLSGCIYYIRNNNSTNQAELKDSLNTTTLQKKHLMDGLFYLFPYHQRNQIPMSLLVIRIAQQSKKQKQIPQQLVQLYKTRLRKCDLLVQIDQKHLAVLLCDTNSDQASRHVVQALKQLKAESALQEVHLSYAVARLPLEQELAIDDVLKQTMQALREAEQQHVERVVFISVKQSD